MTITPEQLAEMCRMADRALAWCIRRDPAADPAHRWRIRWAALTHEPRADHYPADPQAELIDPQEAAKLWAEVERLRRFAPLIGHLAAQYAEHGNLDADMARIASGEAVPFVVLHAKGCNGRHDYRTRCQD